jgi:hypothetical protein
MGSILGVPLTGGLHAGRGGSSDPPKIHAGRGESSDPPTAAADADLMLDVRRGSREAFEGLFTRYRGPIWAFFAAASMPPARRS